jgi:hypothetical protein
MAAFLRSPLLLLNPLHQALGPVLHVLHGAFELQTSFKSGPCLAVILPLALLGLLGRNLKPDCLRLDIRLLSRLGVKLPQPRQALRRDIVSGIASNSASDKPSSRSVVSFAMTSSID